MEIDDSYHVLMSFVRFVYLLSQEKKSGVAYYYIETETFLQKTLSNLFIFFMKIY